ncbi:SurA N-terminal domain-containing protein [Fodinicurvata sp. EGI_FJ10296]|uniref:peptidylprolyl isomerase n=1 Tax=Fodinicurvata sp. EGI_FJ10296 TaxID=3231908 RepID=UPI0034554E6C
MLQAIRSKVGSWVVKILFFVLILSFAVWGIGDMMQEGPPDDTVATVGEMSIDSSRVETAFRNEIQRIRQNFGITLDSATAARMGLLDDTLDRIVDESVMARAASEAGFNVPNEMLIGMLRNQPAFQDQAGNFSPLQFQQTLAASGMTEDQYLATLRQAVGRSQMLAPIANATAAPDVLVNDLFSYEQESRDIEYMIFEASDFGGVNDPDQLTLRSFHAENPELFQAPAYRTLSTVILSGNELADEIAVSEQDIEDRYDQQMDQYTTAERRSFEQVLLDDEDTAADFAQVARDSADLDEALQTAGLDASITPFSEQQRSDIAFDVLAEAVFSTPDDEVGDPVESPFGWHVFKVTEVQDDSVQPLDDVRDEIRSEIQLDRALDRLFQDANRLEDALAAGLSLDEAADETGLSVRTIGPVDAEGRRPDGTEVDDIPAVSDIVQTGFSLSIGETSGLEDLENNVFYVVRADEQRPPETRPFDDVRELAAEEWRAAERRRLMAEAAETAHESASNAPSEFGRIASNAQADQESESGLRRNQSHQLLSQDVISDLFAASQDDILLSIGEDQALVVRLTAIHEADPEDDADGLAEIRDRVRNQIGNDLVSQFTIAWRGQFDVEVNRERLLERLGLADVDLSAEPDLPTDAVGSDIAGDGAAQPMAQPIQ